MYPDVIRTAAIMSLDDYLHKFTDHRRITLVGPTLAEPPPPLEQPVIWVDGGAHHRPPVAARDGLGFSVGDGDSFRGKLDQYLDTNKDYSDLAYVLGCLRSRFAEVVLLGFLGQRRDHELFNLGEVHHFLASVNTPTQVRFDDSVIAYSAGQWAFDVDGVFSLAVLESATVQLVGACEFPIPAPTQIAPLKSFGLSNRGFGTVTLTTGGPVLIIKPAYNQAPE